MVNVFGVWDKIDSEKVYKWLCVSRWVAISLFTACGFILLIPLHSFTSTLYFPVNVPLIALLAVSPYCVKVNGITIFPIITGYTLSFMVLMFILVLLFGVIHFYAAYTNVFKNAIGYGSFGSVRRRINSVIIHGSKREKAFFALFLAFLTTQAICYEIFYLFLMEIIPLTQAALSALPLYTLSLISGYVSERHIKTKILS